MKKNIIRILRDIGLTVLCLTVSTILGLIFRDAGFHKTNVVLVYIFSVLLISRFTKGYLFGIGASVISLLLFNWFFIEPYSTLKVDDPSYIITVSIMTLTAVLTSALTTKVKQAAEDAKEREKQSNALYQLTNHLTDAEDQEAIARVTVSSVSDVLGCSSAFICFDENGMPEKNYIQLKEDGTIIHRDLSDPEMLKQRTEQLHNAAVITDHHYDHPVYGKSSILAVLRIPRDAGDSMSSSQTRLLHSIIESTSLALDRMRSLKAQAQSREETTQERYRADLLRSISHDIRTPLSAMMGTSEMLMDATDKDDPRYGMASDINRDAQWLHGMVENILNLTKLQDGKLRLEKQPEYVEEVIGAALTVMEKRIPDRIFEIDMPDNIMMVPMDARLISQVLVNLLDNADKHSAKDADITVGVRAESDKVHITVADRGCGISEEDLPHIFKMFYTTRGKSPDSRRGVGLGLAICRSIAEAHGGNITAENRKNGGAIFTLTLPVGGENS